MFRLILSFTFSLFLFSNFHFVMATDHICGTSEVEKDFHNLYWLKLGTFAVSSKHGGAEGIICIGVNQDTGLADKFYYQGKNNKYSLLSVEDYKQYDAVIVHQRDVKGVAGKLLKKTALLTAKIVAEKKLDNGNTLYQISFKFLKNLTKGFKNPIIKDLNVNAEIDTHQRSMRTYYISKEKDNLGVKVDTDQIVLRIGKNFTINRINLYLNQELHHKIYTYNLDQRRRKYKP